MSINYNDMIMDLRKLLYNDNVNSNFSDNEIEDIHNVLSILQVHITLLNENKDIKDDYDYKVCEVLNLLVYKTIYGKLNDIFISFLKLFCDLIYNWNINYYCNDLVTSICKLLYNFLNLYKASSDFGYEMRNLITTYLEIVGWMPPMFELNKKHLSELLENNKIEVE